MNKSTKITVSAVFVMLAAIAVYDIFFNFTLLNESYLAMGSVVTFVSKGTEGNTQKAFDDSSAAVMRLDEKISANKVGAEIQQLNEKGKLEVSNITLSCIEKSLKISEMTNGDFDITVGALSGLWQFGTESPTPPSKKDVQNALKTVGSENVVINGNEVTLLNGAKLDLGAIGKGLACDYAKKKMENSINVYNVLSVGGSVYVQGKAQRVGVRDPLGGANDTFASIKIENLAVSTSGVYEKQFEYNGEKYHHLLDLKTGYPKQSDLLSVTVISPCGAESDAFATAFYISGSNENTLKLCEDTSAMAIFVYDDKTVEVVNEIYNFKITNSSYTRR